jgi:hypothetical protein
MAQQLPDIDTAPAYPAYVAAKAAYAADKTPANFQTLQTCLNDCCKELDYPSRAIRE